MADPLDPEEFKRRARAIREAEKDMAEKRERVAARLHGMSLNLAKNLQFVDCTAEQDVDIMIGEDRIVRINIDGVCVMRVRMTNDCQPVIRDMRPKDQALEDWLAGKGED